MTKSSIGKIHLCELCRQFENHMMFILFIYIFITFYLRGWVGRITQLCVPGSFILVSRGGVSAGAKLKGKMNRICVHYTW